QVEQIVAFVLVGVGFIGEVLAHVDPFGFQHVAFTNVPAQLRTAGPLRRRVDLVAGDGNAGNVADVVMTRVAGGDVPGEGVGERPGQTQLHALVAGGGAAHVVAVTVLEDAVFLVVIIGGDGVADIVAAGAVAHLHAFQF